MFISWKEMTSFNLSEHVTDFDDSAFIRLDLDGWHMSKSDNTLDLLLKR